MFKGNTMADIPFPRGVRDLMPNEALFRAEMIRKMESIFQSFGFLTILTPSIESLDILKAKDAIGEDTKLIYEMKDENIGLRYDQTVPLARYFVMHSNMPLPFKRYVIGQSWRMDEPQRLRYREFTQADVDIIGGDASKCDSETIACLSKVLDAFEFKYKVMINNRMLIDDVLESFGVPKGTAIQVMRAVDKLDKIGIDGVSGLLAKAGLSEEQIGMVNELITAKGTNDEKLDYALGMAKDSKAVAELRETLAMLKEYNIRGEMVVDFSTMRGLDYYTGTVFEFKAENESQSIGGGGRYDNLTSLYGGKQLPAVGGTLGIDRLLDVMKFSQSSKATFAKAFVAYIKKENYTYALKVVNILRANGIFTDLNNASRSISNQLSYANSLKMPYAVIVGASEEKDAKAKLRDMASGEETVMDLDELVNALKDKK